MASLTGSTIAASYEQLLSLPDGGLNGNTLVAITDGDSSTAIGMKVATSKIEVIPASDDANAFEVSQADGTAVLTVNTSTVGATLIGALTVGADDLGHDVIFYGDTASSNMTWDTSEDDLVLNDATLFIDQDDNADCINIDFEGTSGNCIEIQAPTSTTGTCLLIQNANSLTTGGCAEFHSNSSDTSTRNVVYISNDHTSATGAVALKIQQDAAAPSIELAGNGGIKFPGTQGASSDANTLDDYEEGTFTPSMTIETGSVTLSTATGYYLKIGSLVWVYCHMVVSAHSGGHADNAWLWSGLPFTNSTNMDNIPIRVYASGLTATTNGLTGYIDNNQTSGRIGAQTTGLSNASLLIQNSLGVYISGTYHVQRRIKWH